METSEKILIHQKGTSRLKYNRDPNDAPYSSFSSFKNIDNTVVSAYEVGAINGVGGKSIPSSKTEEQLVSREHRSLARKPPSGVKHDHKLLGTSSKSKSLTDIHVIHNKGYKIPEVNVQRFDNRLFRHSVKHSKEIVPTLQTSEVDSLSSYSENSKIKGEISVNTYKEIENKDERQASSLSSSDKLFESADGETKLDRTSPVLCNTSTKLSQLHANYSGVNENDNGIDNGIELHKSSLVRVDSGNIHRSRLNHEGSRRHSHRKHLGVRNSSKTENVETVAVEPGYSGIHTVETDISKPGINSLASRRKLPKVPARLKQTTARMSDMEDSKQEKSKVDMVGSGSELGGDKDTDINIAGVQGKPLLASPENSAHLIESDSGKLDTSSGSSECTSQGIVEARKVNTHESTVSDSNFDLDENSSSQLSDSFPSHKQKMVDQGFDKKYEHLTKVKGELKSNSKGQDKQSGKMLGKKSESSDIGDKFRKKLKEIVSSESNRPVNLSNYDDSIVSIETDNGHIEYVQPVSDALSDSAKVLKEQTSPVLHSAKEECKKSNSGILGNAVDLDNDIPASSIFNFNQEVIQELTDLVMVKMEPVGGQCQTPDISETQDSVSEPKDSLTSNISDVSVSIETENKSFDSSQCQFTDRAKDSIEVGNESDLNQSLKLNMEGKSFYGKSKISNECDSEGGAKKEMIHPAGEEIKIMQEKVQKDFTQKQGHVLRTPSYRKRVMARAKLRYSKKSQNFKECSCSRKENGELEQCLFCQKFELKKRSQTSLGHPSVGDYSDSECSEIASPRRALTPELDGRPPGQGHKSPRSLRKVNVSPRVDVLLSSNLFKKHLQKHENLIQKHTMCYKRFGMNKSVSNLDLSEGFTADTDSSYQDNASEVSEPALERDFVDAASNISTDNWIPSDLSATNRRHSLTGETDIHFSDYSYKTMMRKKSGDTLPSSFSKPRSRPGIGSLFDNVRQSRNYIPSFHEFKKQKELATTETKIDKDQQNQAEAQKVETAHVSEEVIVLDNNKETAENDLHTVLEADERGSKENLISVENDLKLKPESDKREPTSYQTVLTSLSAPEVVVTHIDRNQNEHLASKARTRLKGKSRTLPNIDLSIMSDNSSDQSSSHSAREKRRITTKRPRSLISKKLSSHDSDTPDTSDKDHVTSTNVSARPKLKGHHGKRITRSESDTKYETEKGKHSEETVDDRSKGGHSRHLSLLGKGHNSVSFNLDSVRNEGTSDMSSSMTESNLSDSIYSEACINETITSMQDADDVVDNLPNEMSAGVKDDLAASVLRSTSDACEITQEAARKRRERKERPYKSDPFSGTEIIPATKRCALREEKARLREHLSFATSSKEEILSFLDGVNQSVIVHGESFPSLEELSEDEQKSIFESHISDEYMRKLGKHPSNVSSLSTDSGVIGQDESHDSKQSSPSNTLTHSMSEHRPTWRQAQTETRRAFSASCSDLSDVKNRVCYDCNNDTIHQNMSFVCPQCVQRRIERKKIIQEVVDTELNYGRDLKILQEEFYKPMLKAGLLTKDQLDCIFLNLDELIHVNVHFITKLKAAINHSNQNEDEDLREVMIGSLFLESSTMFLTFENYCVNQAQAPILLEQLEKDKELLRIFLHVSQSDNQLLRRMHLKSFLMVPVQRIMKYPLLLDRLYKVTLDKHRDKEALREAKEKIEDILGHINAKSKSTNVKQRKGSEKHYSVTEKIEVSRVALETLGWNRKDVCDVITTRLHITQPLDHMWAVKKCKNHKFTTVHGVLLSLVQQNFTSKDNEPVTSNTILNTSINNNNNNNNNNHKNNNNNNFTNAMNNSVQVQSAAVVLIKEKNGRYQVAREPFMLDKCVVSQDPDFMEVFELLEWNRESYLIKAENPSETKTWVLHLRQQMQNLGCWRKRRNALPNILLNHLS